MTRRDVIAVLENGPRPPSDRRNCLRVAARNRTGVERTSKNPRNANNGGIEIGISAVVGDFRYWFSAVGKHTHAHTGRRREFGVGLERRESDVGSESGGPVRPEERRADERIVRVPRPLCGGRAVTDEAQSGLPGRKCVCRCFWIPRARALLARPAIPADHFGVVVTETVIGGNTECGYAFSTVVSIDPRPED